jgi:hypothetical protein
MPVNGLTPPMQFASWRVPQFPRAIEYPLEMIEEIRAFACDELLQRSHAGDEVAGVLFGTRRDDLIRILTWRPIACDHTQGEGLRLSSNDRLNLAVQLEMARQNPDLKDLRPLGWFVSHSGGVSLSPSDVEIYNGFFPESWQVALVICPQGSGRAQAGFFVREADQKVLPDSSYQCFELEPQRPATPAPTAVSNVEPDAAKNDAAKNEAAKAEVATPAPMAKPAPPPAATAQTVSQAAPSPQPPAAPVSRIEPAKPSPPRESPIEPLPSLSFQIEEPVPARERWLWAIPIVLALGIAAFMLYQRRAPAAIALRASNEAQTVQLVWDANSRAVRDSDRADIDITDGGKTTEVSLTSDQLHSGKLSYLPQSSDVSFTMTIHPATGDPIHDSVRLIAPVFHTTTQPPQLLPDSPAATPPAGHDALERQVQQLRSDLAQERAHANELQNLVRILENRLNIQGEAPGNPKPPQ